nr:MAG TPA: hypothetical protein [Caudoviricetes sp.]
MSIVGNTITKIPCYQERQQGILLRQISFRQNEV